MQLASTFLLCLHTDFYGRRAKEPGGYVGAVITIVMMTLVVMLYRAAGALSEIW